VEGNALKELGLLFHKEKVLSLGRPSLRDGEAFQRRIVVALDFVIMESLVLRQLLADAKVVVSREQNQLTLFECLDVVDGRSFRIETLQVADPPILHREMNDDLFRVFVDDVAPEATFVYICGCATNVAGAKVVLFLLHDPRLQELAVPLVLRVSKIRASFEDVVQSELNVFRREHDPQWNFSFLIARMYEAVAR